MVALVALCVHGANYIVVKTDGELNERARKTSLVLTPVLLVLTLLSLVATLAIHPELRANFNALPIGYAIPVLVFASLVGVFVFQKGRQEVLRFRLRSAVSGVHAGGSGLRAVSGDPAGN